jgi:hypothetical protein
MPFPERAISEVNRIDPDARRKRHRCKSIMAYEKFYGSQGQLWGWRCIWCGDIVDRLILKNRGSVVARELQR